MEQTKHSADANLRPFSVPKGYFDNLTPAVMQKIDGQNEQAAPKRRTPRLLRPIYIAAASLCAAIFGVAVYLGSAPQSPSGTTPVPPHPTIATIINSVDKDAVADYTMMDNEDIYVHYSEI